MKSIYLILASIFISQAQADTQIKEQYFVSDIKAMKVINQHRELIIDHPSQLGFEVYGPKGLGEFLKLNNIDFNKLEDHSHQKEVFGPSYPDYEQVVANLKAAVAINPSIARMYSVGKSHEGRDLWVVKISDNVMIDEVEPEFKYISSMHGDEITGRELTQFLIADIIKNYETNPDIKKLVDSTEIYIMPSMNPDGSELKQRGNAKGVDLNRNFPDWIRGDVNSTNNRQPETQAVMNFQAERKFSLSANFHGGAVVVNYPWDNTYTRHPLDGLLKELSLKYADLNPGMKNSRAFGRGITNGADWYKVHGGMQDWSYSWYNDLQVTVELSNKKWPDYKDIPGFYKDNKDSMMAYLFSIHQGGGIKFADEKTSGVVNITKIDGGQELKLGEFNFSKGEFYKVLPIGEYKFEGKTKSGISFSEIIEVDTSIKSNGNYSQI